VLIYPGALLAWVCGMGTWDSEIILLFLLIPMANDGTAWAAGMLFGKGNQGIVPVSPNKSIAGFIGGLLASVLVGALAVLFLPDIFRPKLESPAMAGVLLGLITGIFANLGDLCESAVKRSAGYKDSGKMFPGRGGMLDSVDSIAMAAPAFYFAFKILFFVK
jgi:phosphatidate cytidylyltransferase